MRGSSPRQKEQKGSSESSPCEPVSPAVPYPCAAGGGSCTSSTSQSAHRVNPCRYSALHCGQYIARRVYYISNSELGRRGVEISPPLPIFTSNKISRRPSSFNSASYKIPFPQLLCFENDPL